jgi:DNA polymerase I-like protein with 3'-5' exonuclease and polymerase domains
MSTLVEMYRQGFDLRLTVHDEIVFQCPKEELDKQTSLAKSIFERPIPQMQDNCFPAEFKYGENWYEMNVWGVIK